MTERYFEYNADAFKKGRNRDGAALSADDLADIKSQMEQGAYARISDEGRLQLFFKNDGRENKTWGSERTNNEEQMSSDENYVKALREARSAKKYITIESLFERAAALDKSSLAQTDQVSPKTQSTISADVAKLYAELKPGYEQLKWGQGGASVSLEKMRNTPELPLQWLVENILTKEQRAKMESGLDDKNKKDQVLSSARAMLEAYNEERSHGHSHEEAKKAALEAYDNPTAFNEAKDKKAADASATIPPSTQTPAQMQPQGVVINGMEYLTQPAKELKLEEYVALLGKPETFQKTSDFERMASGNDEIRDIITKRVNKPRTSMLDTGKLSSDEIIKGVNAFRKDLGLEEQPADKLFTPETLVGLSVYKKAKQEQKTEEEAIGAAKQAVEERGRSPGEKGKSAGVDKNEASAQETEKQSLIARAFDEARNAVVTVITDPRKALEQLFKGGPEVGEESAYQKVAVSKMAEPEPDKSPDKLKSVFEQHGLRLSGVSSYADLGERKSLPEGASHGISGSHQAEQRSTDVPSRSSRDYV